MCEKHEKENVRKDEIIRGRQSTPAPDNENGPSDQNFEAAKGFVAEWKKNLRVGHAHDDRKGDASAPGTPARSFWFDDATKEIGAAPGSTGTVRGWVYVRTKTGHLKKRTGR